MPVEKSGSDRGTKNVTTVERKSDRELVVTRTVNGPARIVFEAWTKPELFKRWWGPRSMLKFLTCEADVRAGGRYRFVFGLEDSRTMEFTGTYKEVTPHSRLVWTSDEGGAEAESVTTATFEERDGKTHLVLREIYPTKAALDEALAGGYFEAGTRETYEQLEEFIATLAPSLGANAGV